MKNFYLLLILLPFLSGCKKESCYDCNDTHTYFKLTQEQIAKTPYFTNSAFDTLTFISNKGDTLTFAKIKTNSSYFRTTNSNCPDCPINYSYYQELKNTYQTLKGNGKFEVRHSKNGLAFDRNLSDFITISFNNFNFFASDFRLGTKNGTIFFDTITFFDRKYFNVTKYYHHFNEQTESECYLNIDFGLISIYDKKNNLKFNLIKP